MEKNALTTIITDSVTKYIGEIGKLTQNNKEMALFYRGQTQLGDKTDNGFEEWRPSPSIFRGTNLSHEKEYYSYVMTECANEFTSCLNHCETLSKMQHYGVPTRLLDITSNALAALFFACVNDTGVVPRQDGVVYVIASDKGHVKEYDSDTITILSSLPRFTEDAQNEIRSHAIQALAEDDPVKFFNNSGNTQVLRLLHEIKKEKPAFEAKIKPGQILDNYVFTPQKTNPRIIKQSGAFVLFGLGQNSIPEFQDNSKITSPCIMYKLVIPQKAKSDIKKALEQCGISLASMYPELYKVAEYLKNSKLIP